MQQARTVSRMNVVDSLGEKEKRRGWAGERDKWWMEDGWRKKKRGLEREEGSTVFTLTFRPDEIAWQVSQLPPQ